jgi:hypothetical protein
VEAPALVPAGVREGAHDLIFVGLLCSEAREFRLCHWVIGSLVNVCFMDHDGMLDRIRISADSRSQGWLSAVSMAWDGAAACSSVALVMVFGYTRLGLWCFCFVYSY